MKNIIAKIIGSRNDRLIKKLLQRVDKINDLEPNMQSLSDEELRNKTVYFKELITSGKSLDDILEESFAVLREASVRVFGMRPYDVQLIGGMVLNSGKIAEMRTGEGKTLMATLAVYLNALTEDGVHVVTVNDYLAQRDAEWMGELYSFLGLTTGIIVSNLDESERKKAYAADITYGTNNEYGFDYLRDNMAFNSESRVQRGHPYAIIDEVDSILIDEARTPLIISGPSDAQEDIHLVMNSIAPKLERQETQSEITKVGEDEAPGDYSVDEKKQQILLTESGYEKVEDILIEEGKLSEGESLYDSDNIILMHHLYSALRAHVLFKKDVHYIVKNDEVIIVDEFTGRTMEGRRWSDGLHQAVEAKENVAIQSENKTVASITFQNYFRLYDKLSGMTGTADTEAFELNQTYGLEVIVIPAHKELQRKDLPDQIYLTEREKYNAIALDIKDCIKRGQPVLVGTASIESSEILSEILVKDKVKHEVLNAKQHEREANIIEQAGMPKAVTIATNMAGRGTDIVLGGNLEAEIKAANTSDETAIDKIKSAWKTRHDEVLSSGGLHIIGSERHESRRIDNQLRGRSGRQGDPGSSRFYLSLEDNLMRIFASGKLGGMMQKLGMKEGEAIEHKWVNKAIENAQRKVEGQNFDMRKNLLEYDDVANDQRKVVYEQRNDLIDSEDIGDTIKDLRVDVVADIIADYIPPQSMEEQWDISGLENYFKEEFNLDFNFSQWLKDDETLHEETLVKKTIDEMLVDYSVKEALVNPEEFRSFEKHVMLQVLDDHWQNHLELMDHLRQGVHLRGYAQKDPKQEYKRESFEMFSSMIEKVKIDTLKTVTKVKVQSEEELQEIEAKRIKMAEEMNYAHVDAGLLDDSDSNVDVRPVDESEPKPFSREGKKIGRNSLCSCGSGKKYKKCHGKLT